MIEAQKVMARLQLLKIPDYATNKAETSQLGVASVREMHRRG